MKKEKGFGAIEALLIVLVVVIIGAAGWYIVQKDDSSSKNNTTSSDTSSSDATDEEQNKGYLVITEWGVRLKEGANSQNAQYAIKDDNTLWLTTKAYVDQFPGCKADGSTGQLIRGKAGYDYNGFGSKIEDYSASYNNEQGEKVTVTPVKVGDYYYMWQGPQAPCAEPTDANESALNTYQQALADLAGTVEASE